MKAHRFLFALVAAGLVWCVAMGAVLWPAPPDLTAYEQPQRPNGNYKPGGSGCEPAAIRSLGPPERQGKTDACAKEAEEHRQVEADLVQQSRAADAAQASAWLTYNQSVILLFGTIFGGATLIAAIAAATFARDAAEHTKAGAVTANLGLLHARQIASQEMRPWLTVLMKDTEARMDDGRFGFDLDLKIQNVGKFPARDIRVRGRLFVSEAGQMTAAMKAFIDSSVDPHEETKMVILPADDYETNIQVSSLLCDLDIVERPNAFIDVILIVKVVYGWAGAETEGQINRCYIPAAIEPGPFDNTPWRGDRLHLSYFRPTWPIQLKDRHYTTMT